MMPCIYRIFHFDSGRSYIGKTFHDITLEFNKHMESNTPLGAAIRHYGREAFRLEVLEYVSDFRRLDSRVDFYVRLYDSIMPFGFNSRLGGYDVRRNHSGKVIVRQGVLPL